MTTREWLLNELNRMGDVRTDRLRSIQEHINRLVLLIHHLDEVGWPDAQQMGISPTNKSQEKR